MLSISELYRVPVFELKAQKSKAQKNQSLRARSLGEKSKADRGRGRDSKTKDAAKAESSRDAKTFSKEMLRRLGRVHFAVFSPSGRTLVGVLVKRPDVAGMVKREDAFCAWDRIDTCENGLVVCGEAAMDAQAIERLGLDWNRCIIWSGMDVATESGAILGRVSDLSVEPDGTVETLFVSDGDWAESFVGAVPIPMDFVHRIRNSVMIVSDEAQELALTGGMAAKAGEAYGKARQKGAELANKAGKAASGALDKGSFALGKALGSAKRTVQEALSDESDNEDARDATSQDARQSQRSQTAQSAQNARAEDAKSDKGVTASNGAQSHDDDPLASVAQALGRQLGKTQGMFGAFMDEFKKASR